MVLYEPGFKKKKLKKKKKKTLVKIKVTWGLFRIYYIIEWGLTWVNFFGVF
jgi:hypothetical protein